MLGFGVAGVGLFGLAQWFAKGRKWIEETGERNVGELK
jgi:hypothetical protein